VTSCEKFEISAKFFESGDDYFFNRLDDFSPLLLWASPTLTSSPVSFILPFGSFLEWHLFPLKFSPGACAPYAFWWRHWCDILAQTRWKKDGMFTRLFKREIQRYVASGCLDLLWYCGKPSWRAKSCVWVISNPCFALNKSLPRSCFARIPAHCFDVGSAFCCVLCLQSRLTSDTHRHSWTEGLKNYFYRYHAVTRFCVIQLT